MSSSIYLKNPPSSWTDVYFNQMTANTINATAISGSTGIFNYIFATTGVFNNISGTTAVFNNISGTTAVFNNITGTTGSIDYLIGSTCIFNEIQGVTGIFDYIKPIDPSLSIQYFGKANFHGSSLANPAVLPMFTFDNSSTNQSTGTSVVYISDSSVGFAELYASVLHLDAPTSLSLNNGTNFIRCTNPQASGAPYVNTVVFNVGSDGGVEGLSFNVWSSKEYKKNIIPAHIDSRKLKDIEPATYQYISDNDEQQRIGIMWEDLEKLHPNACTCVRKELRSKKCEDSEKESKCEKCNSYVKCEDCDDDEMIEIEKKDKKVDLAGAIGVIFALVKDIEERLTKIENSCLKYIN